MSKKPVMLMILDGYGINPREEGNAVFAAKTQNLDKLIATCPNTIIHTSGMDVGLPDGQMGNSEVGHTNIGAGRIVYQELTRITKSIQDGTFYEIPEFNNAMDACKASGKKLHVFGLLSDGGVHGHISHVYAILELAKKKGLEEVYVHCFLDGRDVPPDSAKDFLAALEEKMQEIGVGKIATISGRYYAMDRDNRWERVVKAYDAMVMGEGETASSSKEAIETSYANGVLDEFVLPTVIMENGAPVATIGEGDAVIFYNFRPDRAREITRTFVDPDFTGFERKKGMFPVTYICMRQYDDTIPNVEIAFKKEGPLVNNFGEYISNLGMTQLRIAETEKYAHVTFFFNGGVETMYPGEDRALIPSPKVATYDLKPEMSAYEVTDEVLARIDSDKYDAIILNYANCDMVGHTGVFEAAVAAVEAVDTCVGKVVDKMMEKGGVVMITADHGNSEQLLDYETGGAFTAHTTNVVPMIVVGAGDIQLKEGRLADLAPTMLKIMGLEQPAEMTGEVLIK